MLSSFALETWITFAIAVPFMLMRFALRLHVPGWRNFDGTDVWCAISTALYTIVTACNYLISTPDWPTIIELNEKSAWEVPKEKYAAMERGSKVAHFSWAVYICMIFAFKGVMLSLLRTTSRKVKTLKRVVFWAIIVTVVSWVASILAHFLGCVPIHRVWQVAPYPGATCTTRPQNYIVTGSLNMLTDVIIIAIPMPMLWNLRIPLRRKLALVALFSSGIFIIICTLLRTYYHFGDSSNQYLGQVWSGREGFISMIVIALPGIWPFVKTLGWFGSRDYNSSYKISERGGRGTSGGAVEHDGSRLRSQGEGTHEDADYVMTPISTGDRYGMWSNSEERIVGQSGYYPTTEGSSR